MPATLTVRSVISLYLQHSKATGLHCPQSLSEREYVLGLFTEHLRDTPVEDCKAYHLSDWIEAHTSWKSVSTKRAKANMVKAAFQWAVDGERIDRNPFKKVQYAEAERRPDLPDDFLCKLENLANKRFEAAIRFLRLTGCRLGEMCEATWEDMDLERGIWTINKHKSRRYTKKVKLVALVPEAIGLLRPVASTITPSAISMSPGMTGGCDPHGTIFLNTKDTPWTRGTLGWHLRKMKARHGLAFKASLHGIRHRFGSCGVANGAPLKLISQQMGHASQTTTERYYCDLSGEMPAIQAAARLAIPK